MLQDASRSRALVAATDRLRCPHCGGTLVQRDACLVCRSGHNHDIARQGYISLRGSAAKAQHRGDGAAMVAARGRFLAAGHYEPISDAVNAAALAAIGAQRKTVGCVVDLGAGDGYYLARLLAQLPDDWIAVAIDASRAALVRAAAAHRRIAAVGADIWQALPLADGAADLALNVFAPRNGGEFARALTPGGALVVVTPSPRHLAELAAIPGTVGVDGDKPARLQASLAPSLVVQRTQAVEYELSLDGGGLCDLIAMGPSSHHVDPEQLQRSPARAHKITVSVLVETFGRAGRADRTGCAS